MKLIGMSGIMGLLMIVMAGIADISTVEKEIYNPTCLIIKANKDNFWGSSDSADCIEKRECRGTTALYIIGVVLSLLANGMYGYMLYDERKHRKAMEEKYFSKEE